MEGKWFGALLIISGCGLGGFSLAARHRYAEFCVEQLIRGLEYMSCELQFRLTPLPELCYGTSRQVKGPAGQIFLHLARQLDRQEEGNIPTCMETALASSGDFPGCIRENLRTLALCLGRFDLEGQLQGLDSVRQKCRRDLEQLYSQRDNRIHSYRTLGLCTGAALAILLI